MHVYYFRYPPACRFRRVILDLYMFGHRVAEIGALQAPFDNRYSWFQIKSVRDARTKSDPRQCVHLCIAIFTYHRLYQNDFSNPFPSIVSHNPRFCHTPVTLFLLYHHTVGYIRPVTRMYIHPSHTLSTFLKTHYITHPTHPRASGVPGCTFTGFAQCRQHVVSRYVIQMFLESRHELCTRASKIEKRHRESYRIHRD